MLDETRSAEVIQAVLAGVEAGIISCDRYSAYKKFARLHPGIILAFRWAHQRRDFLELANARLATMRAAVPMRSHIEAIDSS